MSKDCSNPDWQPLILSTSPLCVLKKILKPYFPSCIWWPMDGRFNISITTKLKILLYVVKTSGRGIWGSSAQTQAPLSTFWSQVGKKLEMGPDPTRAYRWSAVNKRPTCLRPGYFLTQPKEIFFDTEGKKLKNLSFLGEIFQIQTQTINGWPDPTQPEPQKIDLTRSGSKIFDPDPSLQKRMFFFGEVLFCSFWWFFSNPGSEMNSRNWTIDLIPSCVP